MSYLKLTDTQVNRVKRIADELTMTELIALCARMGAMNTRMYCIDVVECGDFTPDDVPSDATAYVECGADMICDIVNPADMLAISAVNDLASDLVVRFEQRFVAVKK